MLPMYLPHPTSKFRNPRTFAVKTHSLPVAPVRRGARLPALAAWLLLSAACPVAIAQPAGLEEEAAVDADGLSTVVALSISSYDNLMADVGFVANLAGAGDQIQMFQGMAGMFTAPVDKTRPWGVVLKTDGMQFMPLVCLPIKDFSAVMDQLKNMGIEPEDLGDGVFEVVVPNSPQSVFIKENGDWAFVAQTADALATAPADPGPMLTELAGEYDINIQADVQNVPEMYKQLAMDNLRQGIETGTVQLPDESDEAFEKRKELAMMQMKQMERLFTELDTFNLGLSINSDEGETDSGKFLLDVGYTVLPESKMAEQVNAYENSATNLSGFSDEKSAMSMAFAVQVPPEAMEADLEQIKASLAGAKAQIEQQIDTDSTIPNDEARAVLKSAMNDVMESVEATIMSGNFDGGMKVALQEKSIVAAAHMVNPEKIETAFRKLTELAKDQPNIPAVEWDAETHAGARLHKIEIPIPAGNEEARAMFGESAQIVVGIGEDKVYFSGGTEADAKLKAAMDASQADPGKAARPMTMVVSIKQCVDSAIASNEVNPGQNPEAEAMLDLLSDAMEGAEGQDRMVITQDHIPNGVRMRIELESGVIKAMAAAGKAVVAAQQAAGAGFEQ